jgi:hypothetical protein
MAKSKTPQVLLTIKATGPMLDVVVHCRTEKEVIKKLKEFKKLVTPTTEKVVTYQRVRWTRKRVVQFVPIPGKLEGKHLFEIIHKHPEHPLLQS